MCDSMISPLTSSARRAGSIFETFPDTRPLTRGGEYTKTTDSQRRSKDEVNVLRIFQSSHGFFASSQVLLPLTEASEKDIGTNDAVATQVARIPSVATLSI